MSTKFFTNQGSNTLYQKFIGVFQNIINLNVFYAVVGYFRASGYFAIREHLLKIPKVKILVGINVDKIIAQAQRRGLLYFKDEKKTREEFVKWVQQDIREARYERDVEKGILDFMQDVIDKRIELRVHNSKQLHAKIYIFLPDNFNEHSPGIVITGSSNLTSAGLGVSDEKTNYEFNVELRDYDDVKFACDEFEKLWKESSEILPEDFNAVKETTHIDKLFTPYEIYLKFLFEYFGRNIEYDPETIGDIPQNFKKLTYQVDAVNQGYNMLMENDGFFLADVVGTGKTVVATMLTKKFIITNGTSNTKILVVYPPALEKNWKRTFRLFNIDRYARFVSNGSLDKIVNGESLDYWAKEEYDLILIDEAHKFRNHRSQMFQNLQIICKSGRRNNGLIEGYNKKVVLISATPLNNRPEDIYYQLLLFQNGRKSTHPITNLQKFFGKVIQQYRDIKKEMKKVDHLNLNKLRNLYSEIREKILKPITVRRTRRDLQNTELYKEDLKIQKIDFPKIEPPNAVEYKLDKKLDELFYKTISYLVDENKIGYYRYQAIKFLKPEIRDEFYEQAELVSASLFYIMKTQLVKRLESSFYAFKKSLNKFSRNTGKMIEMFEKGKVFVAPDLDISNLIDKGLSDDEIEVKILEIQDEKPGNRIFETKDFEENFIKGLEHDKNLLEELCKEWQDINYDPKLDKFLVTLKSDILNKSINPTGKLVIFTESKDTSQYVEENLKKNGYSKILTISSENRKNMFEKILQNFDANYEEEHKNDFDFIISTEVLAEGVNLHRANVVVNYDTPWNSTRLMQRLGRVNRIGSVAGKIYNFNFYPSAQSEKEINLKKTAYLKLQAFHTAFGEDSQIYTIQEIIEQFKLFESGQFEEEDIRLKYLQAIRIFRDKNPKEFKQIKGMTLKARTARSNQEIKKSSVCFLKSDLKKELYFIDDEKNVSPLTFEDAVKIFEAAEDEKSTGIPDFHYEQIQSACQKFEQESEEYSGAFSTTEKADVRTNNVKSFLRDLRKVCITEEFEEIYDELMIILDEGRYVNLVIELERIRKKKTTPENDEKRVIAVAKKYLSGILKGEAREKKEELYKPEIIISETFL